MSWKTDGNIGYTAYNAFGIGLFFWSIYLAVWVMLIGGIVDVVDGFKAAPTDSIGVATGIVKAVFFQTPPLIAIALIRLFNPKPARR